MSWEVQFRKAESELELKLSSFQNLLPENDSVKLESEIEQLLIRLNKIMNDQEGQNPKMTGDLWNTMFIAYENIICSTAISFKK